MKTGGSEVQNHPELHSKLQANLGSMKHWRDVGREKERDGERMAGRHKVCLDRKNVIAYKGTIMVDKLIVYFTIA